MGTTLDYADPNMLHVSEFPYSPAEQQYVYKNLNGTAIRCEPSQIVRDGRFRGEWRVTRVWLGDRLLGYVRVDLDEQLVRMRPGNWQNEEMIAIFTYGGPRRITDALRDACSTLLMYDMYQITEKNW